MKAGFSQVPQKLHQNEISISQLLSHAIYMCTSVTFLPRPSTKLKIKLVHENFSNHSTVITVPLIPPHEDNHRKSSTTKTQLLMSIMSSLQFFRELLK